MEIDDASNSSGNSGFSVLGRVFIGLLVLAAAVVVSFIFKGYRQGRKSRAEILAGAREAKADKKAARESASFEHSESATESQTE